MTPGRREPSHAPPLPATPPPPARALLHMLSGLDRLIPVLLAIYGALVLLALLLVPLRFLPAEDAVILHQYSRNLAEHGAITYYAGGPHTEGATEFGWMVLVAAAMVAHIPPAAFTAVVNVLSLLGIATILLRLARLRPSTVRVLAIAGAAGLLPQIFAGLLGFPVLPWAVLLAALTWAVVERRGALTATLALALCLFRPDAVLLAVPLLLVATLQAPRRRRQVLEVLALFAAPGVAYFLWRMHYFDEPLPLPFLVKAQVHRAFGVLVPHSFAQSGKYLLLDAVLLLPLIRRGRLRVRLLLALLLAPTLFYWTVRLDQNVGDRFFSFLPLGAALLVALGWPSLAARDRRLLLRSGVGAFVLLLLGPLLRELRSFRDYQFRDVHAIATGLHSLPTRGIVLTSEAGYLAYDSRWIAYDAWGLNTAAFAHRLIQPGDVVALQPDLVVLHPDHPGDCTPTAASPAETGERTWAAMIRNTVRGTAETGKYELWQLPYGSAFRHTRAHGQAGRSDQECFFLHRTSPDYTGMVQLLRQHHAQLLTLTFR